MSEYIDIPVFTGDIGDMPENLQAIAEHIEVVAKNSGTVPNLKELCAVDG